MSFYSITKYIFSNKEYNAIIAWYDKTCMAANPNIWKEFIKRANPKGDKNSFEYKESLYRKKNVLTKLQTIYTKSSEICSLYPKAVEVWMKENYIYSTPLSFLDREMIIKKESDIHTIYSYLTLVEKNKVGVESYLNDHRKVDTNSIEGRKLILEEANQVEQRTKTFNQVDKLKEKYPYGFESYQEEHSLKNLKKYQNALQIAKAEYEIKKRNKVILEYYEIQETYKDGLAFFLKENKDIKTNTFEGKEIVINNKAVIQYKNSIVKEFHKLATKYKEELECYLKNHSNININSYEGIAQIVSSKDRIISIRETVTRCDEIMRLYPEAYNVFLEENKSVKPETLDGKRYIVSNETEIQSINTIMGKFQSLEVHKNMLSGYICFFNLTFVPNTFPYSYQKQTFEHRKEIRNLQNCIHTIKSFKTLYPKTYPFLIEAYEDPDLKMFFKDNPVLRLKRSEISRISQMSVELQITEDYITKSKMQGNKSITTEVVMDFSEEGLKEKRRYLDDSKNKDVEISDPTIESSCIDVSKTLVESDVTSDSNTNIEGFEEFQRNIKKIKGFKNKYPNTYPFLLKAFEDLDLTGHFNDDPILKLKRSEIRRIARMKDELQITEDFIILSKQFKKSAIDYIADFVDVMDFSKGGIEKKRLLLNYNELLCQIKSKPAIELICDIDDRNAKARCVLNSDLYGDQVTFVESYSTNDFYGLASRIKGYGKTFDEIVNFRNKYSKAIKSFNAEHRGKHALFVNDFELIGSEDTRLMSWIEREHNKEQALKEAKEKVNEIRNKYSNGFKLFLEKINLSDVSMPLEQLLFIIGNESVICNLEARSCAYKIIQQYPDGVLHYLGFNSKDQVNDITAKQIVNLENLIRTKQKEIEVEKLEQERRLQAQKAEEERKRALEQARIKEEQQKKNKLLSLQNRVSTWHTFYNGLKYNYIINYYPTTCDFEATNEEWQDRYTIWNFKNSEGKTSVENHYRTLNQIIPRIKNLLCNSFGNNIKDLTLVCIPASTQENTRRRYEEFSKRICDETGMINSYNKIKVIKPKEERRLGGTTILIDNLQFDEAFFKDRYVLLFDDVITRGESMNTFKKKMESLGAFVVAGFSLGRTKHERVV